MCVCVGVCEPASKRPGDRLPSPLTSTYHRSGQFEEEEEEEEEEEVMMVVVDARKFSHTDRTAWQITSYP
ncbi:hypothetical protein TcWFU_001520 [Taenia crassiceps]|uniref:Uncharacterized protein n=1 Tax=Taenia crassiceps TaxID=6207 RepID=A0ABR4QP84_9CEST